ncbi:MAG TPA: trypsin-like peptidase domain-containing protein [Anaerolineae bacterium]|nr:trypsin-like peptidase domain-containing protein [Anaerolineae bacterium]
MRNVVIGCGTIAVLVVCLGALVLGGLLVLGSTLEATPQPSLIPALPTATTVSTPTSVSLPQATATPTAQVLQRQQLYRAVVEIITWADLGNGLEPVWSGSGTIIGPRGYILTNAHVVLPTKPGERVDQLQVLITEAEDRPPTPRYLAEVVQADERLDLAVIRITADIHGNPVDPKTLHLPVGDSDTLHLGDSLIILGYPGIGGSTITLTKGEVSGFTAEAGYGERAWIKTSATIASGNSGGLAANAQGELVGVPTQLGVGDNGNEIVDCRQLADTNNDGVIDENDTCIPLGGFINALRPINLARPLIQAALEGKPLVQTPAPSASLPQGRIIYEDDFSDPTTGWPVGQDADGETAYRDGAYLMQVNTAQLLLWVKAGYQLRNVIIGVTARVETSVGDGDFGLICRYQDADNFYRLEISEDGFASIWKRSHGEHVPLVQWKRLPPALRGLDAYTIEAACLGSSLKLVVNGKVVAEAHDQEFSTGDVGMIVGTWDTPGFGVLFDDFVLRQP